MIALIVPTIRPDRFATFLENWQHLIDKHHVELVTVWDGDKVVVEHQGKHNLSFMGKYKDLIYNKTASCRNAGFAYAFKKLRPDIYLTLDDDLTPIGDSIQAHLDVLGSRVPVSWMSTASEYVRGVPYGVRSEAEVVVSHGVWDGVKDYDAPTQLIRGNPDVTFYKGAIPKGVYYPMSSMNLAFSEKALPFMYHAPAGHRVGFDRFDDIFCGITSKREIDKNGWAVYSGASVVWHDRASNVFDNLKKEAPGLKLNETFWQGDESDPYFSKYARQRARWKEYVSD